MEVLQNYIFFGFGIVLLSLASAKKNIWAGKFNWQIFNWHWTNFLTAQCTHICVVIVTYKSRYFFFFKKNENLCVVPSFIFIDILSSNAWQKSYIFPSNHETDDYVVNTNIHDISTRFSFSFIYDLVLFRHWLLYVSKVVK